MSEKKNAEKIHRKKFYGNIHQQKNSSMISDNKLFLQSCRNKMILCIVLKQELCCKKAAIFAHKKPWAIKYLMVKKVGTLKTLWDRVIYWGVKKVKNLFPSPMQHRKGNKHHKDIRLQEDNNIGVLLGASFMISTKE